MTSVRREQIAKSLASKEAREAFVAAHIETAIPFQIRANRLARNLTQKKLGELAGMKQPAIARQETGDGGLPNIETLQRLAAAFDIALIVRFAPFSDLLNWTIEMPSRGHASPSFSGDAGMAEPSVDRTEPSISNTENNLQNVSFVMAEPPKTSASSVLQVPIETHYRPQYPITTEATN